MKRSLITCLFCLLLSGIHAQSSYFKGEWTKVGTQELFNGIVKITEKDNSMVSVEIIWTYLAIDSSQQDMISMYKGKKGRMGLEIATGTYDKKTNDIYFEGKEKKDPYNVIGLDKYQLKFSRDKQVLYGKSDANGNNNGLFFAARISTAEGIKKFTSAKKILIK